MAFLKRIKFSEPAPEASPPSGPRSAGHALRGRREELGLSLEEVGGALRIKPAYLAALEEGRPDRLPGSAYAVGFLKSYGEYLGLDGAEVVRRFKAESAGLDAKPDLSFPMPLGERSVPGGGMLLVALILVACGYGAWYYLSTGERLRPQRVGELPAALLPSKPLRAQAAPTPGTAPARPAPASPAPTSAASAAPKPAAAPAAAPPAAAMPAATPSAAAPPVAPPAVAPPVVPPPAAASPDEPTPAVAPPAETASAATPTVKTPPAQPAAAAPATAAAPAATASASGADASRIVIRATADSWIQVRDAGGTVLFTRILKAGDSYQVPDQPGITMDTGNAGGLSLSLDGKPLPPLGGNGEVRRHIALDPEALAAAKPNTDKPKTN
jgi:cytoskeleton protein RodZ